MSGLPPNNRISSSHRTTSVVRQQQRMGKTPPSPPKPAWNHLQVPNYYPMRQPYQTTMWHSPPLTVQTTNAGGSTGAANSPTSRTKEPIASSSNNAVVVDLTLNTQQRNNGALNSVIVNNNNNTSTKSSTPAAAAAVSPTNNNNNMKRSPVKVDSILERFTEKPSGGGGTAAALSTPTTTVSDNDSSESVGSGGGKSRRKSRPCKRQRDDDDSIHSRPKSDDVNVYLRLPPPPPPPPLPPPPPPPALLQPINAAVSIDLVGEVENRLEEMFAGIEEHNRTPPPPKQQQQPSEIIEIDSSRSCSSSSRSSVCDVMEEVIVNQNVVAESSSTQVLIERTPPPKTPPPNPPTPQSQQSTTKKKKRVRKRKPSSSVKKSTSSSTVSTLLNTPKKSTSKPVKRRGPYLRVRNSLVTVINTNYDNDRGDTSDTTRTQHRSGGGGGGAVADDVTTYDLLHKRRLKQLHTSTLGQQYDTKTRDAQWICAFCKRGPHATDFSGPTLNRDCPPVGDLFGPYFITSRCIEFERCTTDPFDTEFKSRRTAKDISSTSRKTLATVKYGGKRKTASPQSTVVDIGSDANINSASCSSGGGGQYWGICDVGQNDMYEVWAHEQCLVWTAGTYLAGAKIFGLQEAVWTCCNVLCGKCQVRGANICCVRRGCVRVMHVCCAQLSGWQFCPDTFNTYCVEHRTSVASSTI